MELSIIIPTIGRGSFLVRLIRYYSNIGFKGQIIIGDGSSLIEYEQTNLALKKIANNINLKHLHLPDSSVSDAVITANTYIEKKYACLVGDDDFIITKTAQKCIEFIEQNEGYIAAHGVGIIVGAYGGESEKVEYANFYPQTIREENNVTKRITEHLNKYTVTLFSVHKVDTWKKMFNMSRNERISDACNDKTFTAELLPCCLSVCLGKIGQVDGLYLIRQEHRKRYILSTWFPWITNDKWSQSYKFFRSEIAKVILLENRITEIEAYLIIDNAFSIYLRKQILRNSHYNKRSIKNIAIKIRYLDIVWRQIRATLESIGFLNSINLTTLTRSSSPYFEEFKEVLYAINNEKNYK